MNDNYPPGITDAIINNNPYFCPNCGIENPDPDSFWLMHIEAGECCGYQELYSDTMGEDYVEWKDDKPHCHVCDEICDYVYINKNVAIGCEHCLDVIKMDDVIEL